MATNDDVSIPFDPNHEPKAKKEPPRARIGRPKLTMSPQQLSQSVSLITVRFNDNARRLERTQKEIEDGVAANQDLAREVQILADGGMLEPNVIYKTGQGYLVLLGDGGFVCFETMVDLTEGK